MSDLRGGRKQSSRHNRPGTADQTSAKNRVKNVATDAVFRKWGAASPSGVLSDSNINYVYFTQRKTLGSEHRHLMNKVDDAIKAKGAASTTTKSISTNPTATTLVKKLTTTGKS